MGILTSEIILYLKTWALWNRSRKLGIFLVCLALFAGVPAAVFLEITLNSAQYVPAPLHGCALTGGNPILFFAWVEIALAETTVAILTLVKGLQHLRQTQTGWVVQLYSDGLLFYVFVLMTTLVNIFLPIAAHGNYGNMFAPVQRVVHSVLSTRILLLILRQRSRRSPSPSSSMSIEIPRNNLQTGDTIQFTTFMIDGTTEDDSTEQFSHFRPFSEPTSHDTPRPAPHTQEGIPEEGSDEAIRETA
ncbi:hypothetical protein DL96DRAFT_1710342 [Flagelloscypha sp. PMI_526]|nr:hypothetical protein DL96DRAFT_1710342 [Flagelloscypha sp. PMI_526]